MNQFGFMELSKVLENCPLPFFVVTLVEIESDDTSVSAISICSAFGNGFVVVNAVEYVLDDSFFVIIAGKVPLN